MLRLQRLKEAMWLQPMASCLCFFHLLLVICHWKYYVIGIK